MAIEVQTSVPNTFTIGDAVSFKLTDSDFPASSWTAKVVFKNDAGTVVSFDRSSIDGDGHVFVLTNANAATLLAGQNFLCFQFSDGTNRQSVDWGDVTVLEDPFVNGTPSFAQAQVTLLQTVLAQFNATGYKTVNFNGQSFTSDSVTEYRDQLTYWQAIVIQERKKARAARGLPNHRIVSPQFVNDGNQGIIPASTFAR